MSKFKVGDMVRLTAKCCMHPNVVTKITAIEDCKYKLAIGTNVNINPILGNPDDYMQLVKPKSEIYTLIINGNAVVLKDQDDKTGVAKCDPNDEFNLGTGVDYAMKRLKGEMEPIRKHKNLGKKSDVVTVDDDPIAATKDFPIEPDWSEVPMGTPVLVRDRDDQDWKKARFVCESPEANLWPYMVLDGMTTIHAYARIKLDKE